MCWWTKTQQFQDLLNASHVAACSILIDSVMSLTSPARCRCGSLVDGLYMLQVETCEEGHACLLYSWHKSDHELATIRECFNPTVLLGTLANPLLPSSSCK